MSALLPIECSVLLKSMREENLSYRAQDSRWEFEVMSFAALIGWLAEEVRGAGLGTEWEVGKWCDGIGMGRDMGHGRYWGENGAEFMCRERSQDSFKF